MLPAHKSPGSDVFSAEYYQTFTTILSPHLQKLFNYAVSTASFPEEMLQATIVALIKPGKKPDCPQNFRPISLLNTDFKIFARIIANSLAIVTLQLVKADQAGFVKGRQAPDGTRQLYNLVHIAETCETPTHPDT